jgi:hypothetical protein
MFRFVSCQEIFSGKRSITPRDIAWESSGLMILLVPSEMLSTCVSFATSAVVNWHSFSSFAHSASPGPTSAGSW